MKPFAKPAMRFAAWISCGRGAFAALVAGLLLAGCAAPPVKESAPASAAPAVAAAPPPKAPSHGDPEQRFKDALQLMKDKKNDEAQAAFESLATDFPQFSGPQTDLGILYARAKQRDKAIASFNKAVADNSGNAVAYDWLGILYREGNAYPNAEQSYLKAIAAQHDDAAAHFNLGILYDLYLKRPADAIVQYREYQRIAGADKVIVTAWIHELEPPAATGPAPAAAAPLPAAAPTTQVTK